MQLLRWSNARWGWALNPMMVSLLEVREWHRNKGKTATWSSRNWSDAAASQGIPRITENNQKLGRGKDRFFPRAFRGTVDLATPWFQTSGSTTVWENNFYCLKPPGLCKYFATAAQETNTTSEMLDYQASLDPWERYIGGKLSVPQERPTPPVLLVPTAGLGR